MGKKVVVFALVVAVVVFVFAAMLDSCNRHKDTKPCFGTTSTK